VAVKIFLRFRGKKPRVRRKCSWNIGKVKDKDSTPGDLKNRNGMYPHFKKWVFLLTHNGFCIILSSDQEVKWMRGNVLRVKDEFKEVDTRTIDDRNRLTLGELVEGSKRVRLYKNDAGELLLRPVVEIPASEAWLFRNEQAMENVKAGLKDASEGKISKLNLKDL
jgi:hypothetical protein